MSEQITDVVAFNKQAIIEALKPHGIVKVTVEYYGGGDSGGTEDVRLELENGETVSTPNVVMFYADARSRYNLETGSLEVETVTKKEMALSAALEDFAMHLVESHHAGWENNDGGRGTVTFHVNTNEITVEHEEYYTESNSYSYTY